MRYPTPPSSTPTTPARVRAQKYLGRGRWLIRALDHGFNLDLLAALLTLAFVSLAAAQSMGGNQRQGGLGGKTVNSARPVVGLFFKVGAADKMLPAPIQYSDVKISISGLIVRVKLRQHFYNPTNYWLEGVYVFPLPPAAAVDRLVMRIGGRAVHGKILEKRRARKLYLAAKTKGRKASMISAERSNVFFTEVANIGPGETIVMDIEYQDTAKLDGERFSYRFPMVVAPRHTPPPVARVRHGGPPRGSNRWQKLQPIDFPDLAIGNPGDGDGGTADLFRPVETGRAHKANPLALTLTLAPGFPLADLKSAYHRVTRSRLADGRHRLVLADQAGKAAATPADSDFLVSWTARGGPRPTAAIFGQQIGNDSFLTLMISPPDPKRATTTRPARDLILVLDVSGSMHGTSIRQAKAALAKALKRLGPQDRFDLVIFSHQARALFGRPVPADADRLRRALDFVAQLTADGGTNILAGLDVALALTATDPARPKDKDRLKQIVFLTDGAVSNEAAVFARIENGLGRARLFTVGIGSAPNALLMKKAAEIGRGSFTYIGDINEVEPRMNAPLSKLERSVLTDIKLAWPPEITGKVRFFPNPIPDLYADQPVMISARIENQKLSAITGAVRLSGRTGSAAWHRPVALDRPVPAQGLAALWAKSWIERLQDPLRRAGDVGPRSAQKIRQEIIDLALKYGLVTEYTALVALARRASRPAASDLVRKEIPRALPAGWDPPRSLAPPPARPGYAP